MIRAFAAGAIEQREASRAWCCRRSLSWQRCRSGPYVDGWQLECCGDPFAVGDEVEWTLTLVPGHAMRQELLVDFSREVEAPASDTSVPATSSGAGGLRIAPIAAPEERIKHHGLAADTRDRYIRSATRPGSAHPGGTPAVRVAGNRSA
jgi:hypothetical protein